MSQMSHLMSTNDSEAQIQNLPLPVFDWRKGIQGRFRFKTNMHSIRKVAAKRGIFEVEIATAEEHQPYALQDPSIQEYILKRHIPEKSVKKLRIERCK